MIFFTMTTDLYREMDYLFTYLFEMASHCVAHITLKSTHHIAHADFEWPTLNL